jgi:hypothetical protein
VARADGYSRSNRRKGIGKLKKPKGAAKPKHGKGKISTLDATALLASVKHHPGAGKGRNFGAPSPVHRPEANDAPRDAMTPPNVFWTLVTPLATIIGTYSNCPEGGQIQPDQAAWLESELAAALKGKAPIVAVLAAPTHDCTYSRRHFTARSCPSA